MVTKNVTVKDQSWVVEKCQNFEEGVVNSVSVSKRIRIEKKQLVFIRIRDRHR